MALVKNRATTKSCEAKPFLTGTDIMSNIINSWSLISFMRQYDCVKRANLQNKETGEGFSAYACFNNRHDEHPACFVGFSKTLGELSHAEVMGQKDDLQVVQTTSETGNSIYRICTKGEGGWQEVEF